MKRTFLAFFLVAAAFMVTGAYCERSTSTAPPGSGPIPQASW